MAWWFTTYYILLIGIFCQPTIVAPSHYYKKKSQPFIPKLIPWSWYVLNLRPGMFPETYDQPSLGRPF